MQQICSSLQAVGRRQQLPSDGLFDELIDSGTQGMSSRDGKAAFKLMNAAGMPTLDCRRLTRLSFLTTSRVLIIGYLARWIVRVISIQPASSIQHVNGVAGATMSHGTYPASPLPSSLCNLDLEAARLHPRFSNP